MVDVVMPKMGESITEGTILEWKKNIGESIDKDEPLLEIATDKVDSEVPSPASGILIEINAKVNDTVPVGNVIARIGEEEDANSSQQEEKKNILDGRASADIKKLLDIFDVLVCGDGEHAIFEALKINEGVVDADDLLLLLQFWETC